jgi:hypothetical protein
MNTSRLAAFFTLAGAWAQTPAPPFLKTTFESRPAVVLSNGALTLTVALQGGAFAKLIRTADPHALSPLWDPARAARQAGQPSGFGNSLGHFVCVDGFGRPSATEQRAGLPGHGEAHVQPWEIVHSARQGPLLTLKLIARLPLAQEVFTRTIGMADGENVIYVHSQLQSLVAFDRSVSWAEHATIGAPFLEPSVTVLDVSGKRAMTRPYEQGSAAGRRLASGKEFTWPMAPARDGSLIDLRAAPAASGSNDIVTIALESSGDLAFVTAIHPPRRLIFGYVLLPSEYPWLQDWQHFPNPLTMARGMEFSTQPFGLSRREAVEIHSLLGRPAFRWLPAETTIETSFIMFYADTPPRFAKVDAVKFDAGRLILQDSAAGERVVLPATFFEQLKGNFSK